MPTEIKTIRNLHQVAFGKGSFDNWCVYLTRNNQQRYAPRDIEYFGVLKEIGNRHGHRKIYNDFVRIYEETTAIINHRILDGIARLSAGYDGDGEEIEIWLTVIYAGMVAEENKANAILKKRIKRLGMHQLLVDNMPADYAAGFSKGKNWRELDEIMRQKGF